MLYDGCFLRRFGYKAALLALARRWGTISALLPEAVAFMWFKNIRAYRLTSPFDLSAEQLGEQLAQRGFLPCAKSQALSLGWVPALGEESGELVHAAGGRLLLKLKREEKLLPSTVVREQLEEKVAAIEAEQARKVYRKERLSLKDEIVQDCLPRAFTRSAVCTRISTRGPTGFLSMPPVRAGPRSYSICCANVLAAFR